MKEEKYILISMDDVGAKSLSDVLGNKTCNKIIDHLSEKGSASQKDLSDSLNMPINTVEYNIKKLLKSGLIKKHKEFFWSVKGKKIVMYELSNKSIIISPKGSGLTDKLRSILPAFMILGSMSILTYAYEKSRVVKNVFSESISSGVAKGAPEIMALEDVAIERVAESMPTIDYANIATTTASSLGYSWAWFFAGAFIAVTIFSIVNWKKL